MDQHKLRSLVFDKTGVRIDVDDPIFALVALNEAVLEETVARHVALIDAASRELAQHARAAGGLPEAQPAPAAASSVVAGAADTPVIAPPHSAASASGAVVGGFSPREWRLLGAAAAVSVLSAVLVLGGQALFFKPVPPPAPVVQAKSLTAEQLLAIQNGEKLARAVQKLDPKARNLVQAEMQK